MTEYPIEILDEDEDDGTMPGNLEELTAAVVGHRIVAVEKNASVKSQYDWSSRRESATVLVLDNGKRVELLENGDCCAYTEVEDIILNLDKIDHAITGVGTTDGYTTWHIYADLGDVVEMQVGWSCGNPFYYGYGFTIRVTDSEESNV